MCKHYNKHHHSNGKGELYAQQVHPITQLNTSQSTANNDNNHHTKHHILCMNTLVVEKLLI